MTPSKDNARADGAGESSGRRPGLRPPASKRAIDDALDALETQRLAQAQAARAMKQVRNARVAAAAVGAIPESSDPTTFKGSSLNEVKDGDDLDQPQLVTKLAPLPKVGPKKESGAREARRNLRAEADAFVRDVKRHAQASSESVDTGDDDTVVPKQGSPEVEPAVDDTAQHEVAPGTVLPHTPPGETSPVVGQAHTEKPASTPDLPPYVPEHLRTVAHTADADTDHGRPVSAIPTPPPPPVPTPAPPVVSQPAPRPEPPVVAAPTTAVVEEPKKVTREEASDEFNYEGASANRQIKITEKTMTKVVAAAVRSVPGVITVQGGLDKVTGRGYPRCDLKLDSEGDAVAIDTAIAVSWPAPVTLVAEKVRETIINWVSDMTDVPVTSANVTVGLVEPGHPRVTPAQLEAFNTHPVLEKVRVHRPAELQRITTHPTIEDIAHVPVPEPKALVPFNTGNEPVVVKPTVTDPIDLAPVVVTPNGLPDVPVVVADPIELSPIVVNDPVELTPVAVTPHGLPDVPVVVSDPVELAPIVIDDSDRPEVPVTVIDPVELKPIMVDDSSRFVARVEVPEELPLTPVNVPAEEPLEPVVVSTFDSLTPVHVAEQQDLLPAAAPKPAKLARVTVDKRPLTKIAPPTPVRLAAITTDPTQVTRVQPPTPHRLSELNPPKPVRLSDIPTPPKLRLAEVTTAKRSLARVTTAPPVRLADITTSRRTLDRVESPPALRLKEVSAKPQPMTRVISPPPVRLARVETPLPARLARPKPPKPERLAKISTRDVRVVSPTVPETQVTPTRVPEPKPLKPITVDPTELTQITVVN